MSCCKSGDSLSANADKVPFAVRCSKPLHTDAAFNNSPDLLILFKTGYCITCHKIMHPLGNHTFPDHNTSFEKNVLQPQQGWTLDTKLQHGLWVLSCFQMFLADVAVCTLTNLESKVGLHAHTHWLPARLYAECHKSPTRCAKLESWSPSPKQKPRARFNIDNPLVDWCWHPLTLYGVHTFALCCCL